MTQLSGAIQEDRAVVFKMPLHVTDFCNYLVHCLGYVVFISLVCKQENAIKYSIRPDLTNAFISQSVLVLDLWITMWLRLFIIIEALNAPYGGKGYQHVFTFIRLAGWTVLVSSVHMDTVEWVYTALQGTLNLNFLSLILLSLCAYLSFFYILLIFNFVPFSFLLFLSFFSVSYRLSFSISSFLLRGLPFLLPLAHKFQLCKDSVLTSQVKQCVSVTMTSR
jgi:hypothetical protein